MSERTDEIVEENIKIIYRFSQPDTRYPCLSKYIKKSAPLRDTLLSILNWLKGKNIFRYNGQYTFHMSTKQINEARHKKTSAVSNRHMNMLCSMGIFKKLPQIPEKELLTEINKEFLKQSKRTRAIGTYGLVQYTDENLEKIEQNCARLKDGVTAGNIGHDTLHANGLDSMADATYYANKSGMVEAKKDAAYQRIVELLTQAIEEKGYCTKQELYGLYKAETGAYRSDEAKKCEDFVDEVMRKYKSRWTKKFWFKPPKKSEIKKYGLECLDYIYILRDEK